MRMHVVHLSSEIDIDFSRLLALFEDYIAFIKSHRPKLFEIIQVEAVRAILQEAYG